MGTLWLKIKVWTKVILFCLLLLYILLFVANNSSNTVHFWFWFRHEVETSVLVLVSYVFVIGAVVTILVRTSFKTAAQFREMRQKNRVQKMHREMTDMHAKAAMLRPKPQTPIGVEDLPADEG